MITRLVKASAEATVAVGPTSTLVLELDVRNDEQIVVQMTNLSAGQVLSAEVHRKTTTGTEYAPSTLGDFAAIAAGDTVAADLDVSATAYIRVYASYDGAGEDVLVSADRKVSS